MLAKLVIFQFPRKQITKKMKFPLSGQKIRKKTCTKYLGVLIDKQLLFKNDINFLKQKLNRANGILLWLKLRHHLPSASDTLRTVYTSTLCHDRFGDKATVTYY